MHADLLVHSTLRTDRMIVLEEKRAKVCLVNTQQHPVFQIKVDNGVIVDVARVDYALRRENVGDLLVELKGGDIEKACDQVASTIKRWKEKKYTVGRLSALVVSTRRPNVATEWQIKSKRILKEHGVVTKFVSSGKTLKLPDLLPDPPDKKKSPSKAAKPKASRNRKITIT